MNVFHKILKPITKYLSDDVNEVTVNYEKVVFVESNKGGTTRYNDDKLTNDYLLGIAQQIASGVKQELSEKKPILSCSIPQSGERVQIVIPPACEVGTIGISIRKSNPLSLTLDDLEKYGTFSDVRETVNTLTEEQQRLKKYLAQRQFKEFFNLAVKSKQNIILSGGTSSGKTTIGNALIRCIPPEERIITIEDTREIKVPNENRLHLLATGEDQGIAKVSYTDLLKACLRLNPERILMAELRGEEAFAYLRGINSGHPGSITTLHADSPNGAIAQLVMMIMQSGVGLSEEQIKDYVLRTVDVIIQARNINGKRVITEVYYEPERKLI